MGIIVSFPRSGQHLVESILRYLAEKHEVEWSYCNFYKNARGCCCNSLPCKEGSFASKNHDFDIKLPIDDNSKYIAIYRKDMIIQLEAYYRYSLHYENKKYKYEDLLEFIINNREYYKGFVNKWIKNKNKNILKVEYYDLINNSEKISKKIFKHFYPEVKIKNEVFENMNEKKFSVFSPIKKRNVDNKIKEIHKLDEELYKKIKSDLKKLK
jgi:hypothetical protein